MNNLILELLAIIKDYEITNGPIADFKPSSVVFNNLKLDIEFEIEWYIKHLDRKEIDDTQIT